MCRRPPEVPHTCLVSDSWQWDFPFLIFLFDPSRLMVKSDFGRCDCLHFPVPVTHGEPLIYVVKFYLTAFIKLHIIYGEAITKDQ